MDTTGMRPHAANISVGQHLRARLEALPPAYFAMAMATGIVSLAGHALHMTELAWGLFGLNVVAFAALWLATALRVMLFPQACLKDLMSHARGPGYFTTVAATTVVGTQCVVIGGAPGLGFALWCAALALWIGCTYAIFLALIVHPEKPSLGEGLNGGWLVASVATQGICVLGSLVLPGRLASPEPAAFLLLCFWLAGGMLYVWIISLIFYRYTFFAIGPAALLPTYWINMGAVAIATLAGTTLVGLARESALLGALRPFVEGLTILCWAVASWWIPLLISLGIWRHVVQRHGVAYDPLYWGLVFPLGMYAVCTHRLAALFPAVPLLPIAYVMGLVAVLAWTTIFFGLLGRLVFTLVLALRPVGRTVPGVRSSPSVSPTLEANVASPIP